MPPGSLAISKGVQQAPDLVTEVHGGVGVFSLAVISDWS